MKKKRGLKVEGTRSTVPAPRGTIKTYNYIPGIREELPKSVLKVQKQQEKYGL